MTASSLQGQAPLAVHFTKHIVDHSGSPLVVTTFVDGEQLGSVEIPHRPQGTDETLTSTLSFPGGGIFNVTETVSDGTHLASASIFIEVLGDPVPTIFHEQVNTTAACPLCSGGVPVVGRTQPIGALACDGFRNGQNGTDCLWFQVPAEWVGRLFLVNTEDGSDVEAEVRSDCTQGPQTTSILLTHQGGEGYDLTSETGCIVLWTFYSPGTIDFQVFE